MAVNPIQRLEDWTYKDKSRHYRICCDDGFGAGCITVTLHNKREQLKFTDAELMRREDLDDWPGLAATIIAAVEEAEKQWPE